MACDFFADLFIWSDLGLLTAREFGQVVVGSDEAALVYTATSSASARIKAAGERFSTDDPAGLSRIIDELQLACLDVR